MRLACMQPYLIPYVGYFRLFETDVFVFHDDAQYIKQSYINRNQLTTHEGKTEWLTLPLKAMPTETKINDIEFADKAQTLWGKQCRRFRVFSGEVTAFAKAVEFLTYSISPVKVIENLLGIARAKVSGFKCSDFHSSSFANKIDPDLKGQDRVLAICKHFRATEYINAPGGKDLYDPEAFKKRGIELKILKPYEGNMLSILERLAFENVDEVRKEIQDNVRFY